MNFQSTDSLHFFWCCLPSLISSPDIQQNLSFITVPNDTVFDFTKLQADDSFDVTIMMSFVLENMFDKDNADNQQDFIHFQLCFVIRFPRTNLPIVL